MKKLLLLLVFATGCHNPNAPTESVCYTQPRWYCSPTGQECWKEIDEYTVIGSCPLERIR